MPLKICYSILPKAVDHIPLQESGKKKQTKTISAVCRKMRKCWDTLMDP
jgi:hypothetical protein